MGSQAGFFQEASPASATHFTSPWFPAPATLAATHRLLLAKDAREEKDRGQGNDDVLRAGGGGRKVGANVFTGCGERNWGSRAEEREPPSKEFEGRG